MKKILVRLAKPCVNFWSRRARKDGEFQTDQMNEKKSAN